MRVTDEMVRAACKEYDDATDALSDRASYKGMRAALESLSHAAGQEVAPVAHHPTMRQAEILAASILLVRKLDEVHADPKYMVVWQIAQGHVGPYAGPKYDSELARLRAAIVPLYDHPAVARSEGEES